MSRVALAGIWHETNTFVPWRTELEDFRRYQYAVGEEVLTRYSSTGTELGGAMAAAAELGIEIVPLAYAAAVPSGLVTAEAFERLRDQIVDRLRGEKVDGIVLALHGAMVVDQHPDSETELVGCVRELVGDGPAAVTLDIHGNPGESLAKAADILVGYDTFPHVDMGERGEEAMKLVARMLREDVRPDRHIEKLPLITVPQMQETDAEPMRSIMRSVHELEEDQSVWTASALPGYAYADVDRLGFAVYVAGIGDCVAQARSLARMIWQRREGFLPELLDPEEAVRRAVAYPDGPTVLVDVADNVGGGSPGDGTVLLEALDRIGARNAVAVVWDPHAVEEIYSVASDRMTLPVGGRATEELGHPVVLSGSVRRLGEVTYHRSGPYMRGQPVPMGRVAILEARAGSIVITERRVMPFDDDHIRAVGIEPRERQIIVAKSAIAWKAAFGSYAARGLFVRTPGFCPSDLEALAYRARPRPAYPLEEHASWPTT